MQLKTSINNAIAVANRISKVNGIIATPEGHREYIKIHRAWLFGSTARHKKYPNDTDLLLEWSEVGRSKRAGKTARRSKQPNIAKTDKEYKRRHGVDIAQSSVTIIMKYLRKNLKMVRFHDICVDGKYASNRILIYPRNDLDWIWK